MNSTGQKIEQLYAWIADEGGGAEGIMAGSIDGETWMPLISSKLETMWRIRPVAARIAASSGIKCFRLKCFSTAATLEENLVRTPEETT